MKKIKNENNNGEIVGKTNKQTSLSASNLLLIFCQRLSQTQGSNIRIIEISNSSMRD